MRCSHIFLITDKRGGFHPPLILNKSMREASPSLTCDLQNCLKFPSKYLILMSLIWEDFSFYSKVFMKFYNWKLIRWNHNSFLPPALHPFCSLCPIIEPPTQRGPSLSLYYTHAMTKGRWHGKGWTVIPYLNIP